MRLAKHLPLLITVTALISACGSNNFAGESGNVETPTKQESSKKADDSDSDKQNDDQFDSDENQSKLKEETDACNEQGGILLNDSCQVCPAGQTVDYVAQSCIALAGDSATPSAGSIGDSGSSVDVKGLVDVFGELIKNLPQDDGSGGGNPGAPGGGGCG
jgi:hypothetical protein